MRPGFLGGVFLVAFVAVTGVSAQDQFHVFARLSDNTGAPVETATVETFRILEDGVEGKVVKVEPVDWPLKLQILVDNGLGMGSENLGLLRESLRTLIDAVPPNAEVTLVTTAPQPRFLVRSTKDHKALQEGVNRLAPDSSTGFFVASLAEALERISRDKSDHFPVILTIGTTTGDADVRERDAKSIQARLNEQRHTIVHVVMITSSGQSLGGGANQADLGISAAKQTRGRYENINNAMALRTVLVSFAEQIGKSFNSSSGRFRVTVQRPSGKSGNLGKVGVAARGGLVPSDVTVEAK